MLVMFGEGEGHKVMILAITADEVDTLESGQTVTFANPAGMTCTDIWIMWGRDKQHVLEQVQAAGVTVSRMSREAYLRHQASDPPKVFKPS